MAAEDTLNSTDKAKKMLSTISATIVNAVTEEAGTRPASPVSLPAVDADMAHDTKLEVQRCVRECLHRCASCRVVRLA
jgi:hypothetical protein